jgi:hypothetical protein
VRHDAQVVVAKAGSAKFLDRMLCVTRNVKDANNGRGFGFHKKTFKGGKITDQAQPCRKQGGVVPVLAR